MALIKVLIIFVVILALLNKSLPLYLAMIFGSLLMIVMFRLPLATAGQTALHTLTGWDVWSVNLAMYVISVLVYELDLRHRFEDAQRAMNGLMRDPRLKTSLACMFIGLMQGPATYRTRPWWRRPARPGTVPDNPLRPGQSSPLPVPWPDGRNCWPDQSG